MILHVEYGGCNKRLGHGNVTAISRTGMDEWNLSTSSRFQTMLAEIKMLLSWCSSLIERGWFQTMIAEIKMLLSWCSSLIERGWAFTS